MRADQRVREWAASLGVELRHRGGSQGEFEPGVALFVDFELPDRDARIVRLLRRAGREGGLRRISFRLS